MTHVMKVSLVNNSKATASRFVLAVFVDLQLSKWYVKRNVAVDAFVFFLDINLNKSFDELKRRRCSMTTYPYFQMIIFVEFSFVYKLSIVA
jgi:hypothetical protein